MEPGFKTVRPKTEAARSDPALNVMLWMSRNVYTVPALGKLVDAVDLMSAHRIRHVPVVDGQRLIGIISDRDVREALPRPNGDGRLPELAWPETLTRKAVDVMTRCPLTISKDFSIREAAEIMCREKIGALPVMDDGRMIGIISAEDLLWALMQITGGDRRAEG